VSCSFLPLKKKSAQKSAKKSNLPVWRLQQLGDDQILAVEMNGSDLDLQHGVFPWRAPKDLHPFWDLKGISSHRWLFLAQIKKNRFFGNHEETKILGKKKQSQLILP